jgi:hypothetical protein
MEKSTPTSLLKFIDNRAISGREDKFITVMVAVAPVLASWKDSLFAHEWLTKDGRPKPIDQLSDAAREKRELAETLFTKGDALERPVLGLGIMDNLEIGAGKDVLITLAAHDIDVASVHIPKSHIDDFKIFIKS